MRTRSLVVAVAAALSLAGSARAVTVITNPGGQLDEMLFNAGDTTSNTVTLQTKTSPNLQITATGDALLDVNGTGFAVIAADSTPFSTLTFAPVGPLLGFDKFQFTVNPDNTLNPSQPDQPTFKISWTTNGGSGFQFVDLGGNKAYELDSGLNEYITSITLSDLTGYTGNGRSKPYVLTGGGFDQAKQISITGPVVGVIPEPAAWAMMLIGFFGVGSMLRSARQSLLIA